MIEKNIRQIEFLSLKEGPGLERQSHSHFSLAVLRGFYPVWVNIVPRAGDISNCRLDLSVGPIFRRQSRLWSHAIIDILQRVSIPGSGFSRECLTAEPGIATGENSVCVLDSTDILIDFPSCSFLNLRGWAHVNLFLVCV